MMRARRRVASGLVLGAVLLWGGAPSLGAQSATCDLVEAAACIDTALAVPMRDGVVLRADLWRPATGGPFPVLLFRTPYGRSDGAEASGVTRAAVARGYAVVHQDVRGRYGSEGEFDAYRNEGRDGYDTIEWAARQPWSTGAVGTIGLSYPAAVQWLAARERPPALRAMVPAMTYAVPEQFWYAGGVWDGSWLDWTWFNIAPDLRRRLGVPGPATDSAAAEAASRDLTSARRWRPLLTLPDFQGIAPWYYEWMRHPPRDPWWAWAALPTDFGDVRAAVLNVSGWFDEPYGPAGAVTNFVKLTESRGGPAGARLVLGPWQHGVDAIQGGLAGKRDFGPAAAREYAALVLDWMDAHLKQLPTAASLPVEVFVMGANRWRAFPRWPVPGLRPDTLRLAGRADARTIGALRSEAGGPPSAIASDPAHPLTDPFRGAYGAHDYAALAPRPGLVAFETAPFSHPVEIIGEVTAEFAVQASVPDFDLWLQLYDVAPDGTAWNLASPGTGLVRASYRNGGPARELVPEGELVRLRMSQLYTANRFATGHRLRIVLSTAFFPLFSVNPQTGALETESAETRAGVIRIRHDAAAGSWVVLPVVPDAGR